MSGKKRSEKQCNTSMYLPPTLKEKIREHGRKNERTLTQEVQWLVKQAFANIEAEENLK